MLEKTSRDAPLVPTMAKPVAAFRGYLEMAADALVAGRPERGRARRSRASGDRPRALLPDVAVAACASRASTMREAAAVMAALVEAAGGARPAKR